MRRRTTTVLEETVRFGGRQRPHRRRRLDHRLGEVGGAEAVKVLRRHVGGTGVVAHNKHVGVHVALFRWEWRRKGGIAGGQAVRKGGGVGHRPGAVDGQ